jgi:hypothetical protein
MRVTTEKKVKLLTDITKVLHVIEVILLKKALKDVQNIKVAHIELVIVALIKETKARTHNSSTNVNNYINLAC